MKKKSIATVLALLLGFLGLHRFYLGQRKYGIAQLVLAIVTIVLIAATNEPNPIIIGLIFTTLIIGIIDFFLLLFMSKYEFRAKYQMQDLQYMNSFEKEAFLQQNDVAQLPNPTNNTSDEDFSELLNEEVKEKIARYGRLYEKGMLTEQEFLSLKKSLRRNS